MKTEKTEKSEKSEPKLKLSRATLKNMSLATGVRAGCVLTYVFQPSALCPTKSICGCHTTV